MNAKRIALLVAILVCCAGMAMAQTEWVEYLDNPVIGLGDPGEWDDDTRGVLAVHVEGSVYHLWFVGGNVDGEFGDIGHATSSDGVEWTMDPANPVLTRGEPGEWDDFFLFGAGVVHDGSQYHLWYSGVGTQTGIYQGGYATSPDGTVWTKHPDNPVLTPGPTGAWDDGGVDPHTVILEDGVYRMWYSGGTPRVLVQTGYAESTDGVHWTKHPNPVVETGRHPGAWDSIYVENAYVAFDGATYHMWYTGWGDDNEGGLIGYAFSDDGIEWTKHGDSWVFRSSEGVTSNTPVFFDGTTFHMWYGQAPSIWDPVRIGYATSDCCWPPVAALDDWLFIPAAAVASGAQGSFYQTDVDLNNAAEHPVEYEFLWLPRGETNTEPMTSEPFSLGAGMSVRYANVLSEVFGLEPNSFGALSIMSSSPDLLAMSRTYNNPEGEDAGTFGQAIPAVPLSDFIGPNERRRILFASEHEDLRFNVGCQNGSENSVVVNLELFDHEGVSLETTMMILRALGNDQLNRLFQDYMPVNGYVDVWGSGSFYCYGSVLDNVTSDPTTILPQ